jgi:hypothetical protein
MRGSARAHLLIARLHDACAGVRAVNLAGRPPTPPPSHPPQAPHVHPHLSYLQLCDHARDAADVYNALTGVCFEEALAAARAVDEKFQSGGKGSPDKPLEGVPISIKERCVCACLAAPHPTLAHIPRSAAFLVAGVRVCTGRGPLVDPERPSPPLPHPHFWWPGVGVAGGTRRLI